MPDKKPTRDSLNEKIELEAKKVVASATEDDLTSFHSEVEIKTQLRDAFIDTSMTDEMVQELYIKADVLDEAYHFFKEESRDNQVHLAVWDYLEKVERKYLAKKLYNCALTEYEMYIENVKTMPPDEIIKEAQKITDIYELMCCLHPDRAILDTDRLKGLLTVDGPLMSLYEQWLQRDYSYTNAMVDVIQTAADSLDIDFEDGSYPADLDVHGRHDLLSEDEDDLEP